MHSKRLSLLILSYVMVLSFANWFDARLITAFGLTMDAGTLIFPLSFILDDVITEVYGYKNARLSIWLGFVFNFLYVLYGWIILQFPGPTYNYPANAAFDLVFNTNLRIIVASFISYFFSEPLNAFIIAKLKIKMHGNYMSLRFLIATIVACFVDSAIFGTLAFWHTMQNVSLIQLILTMWSIKIMLELFILPISVILAKRFKHVEKLDIYDFRTRFTIFSLNDNYSDLHNFWHKDVQSNAHPKT